ncbi:MAG: DNA polymerase III subunit chi [Gallionella sp.]
MTKVRFYTNSADKLRTTCQLSHKAMQQGLRTVISLPDAVSCEALDKLMWHYPDTAFIPHCRHDKLEAMSNGDISQWPVVLSYDNDHFPHYDILISLHSECLSFFSRFDRLIEIISTEVADRHRGRERYKFYRDQGYEMCHFDLEKVN